MAAIKSAQAAGVNVRVGYWGIVVDRDRFVEDTRPGETGVCPLGALALTLTVLPRDPPWQFRCRIWHAICVELECGETELRSFNHGAEGYEDNHYPTNTAWWQLGAEIAALLPDPCRARVA